MNEPCELLEESPTINTSVIFYVDLIGRVVSLKGIESKPELNGKYGLIKEHDGAKDRYLIQLLDYSSSALNNTSMLLKYEKLSVLSPKTHLHNSIYGHDINWKQFLQTHDTLTQASPPGIIRIPSGISTANRFDDQLYLTHPWLIQGAPGTSTCAKGYHLPLSCISARLYVKSPTDSIEVENILFNCPRNSLRVLQGTIVFRHCRFKGDGDGILTIDDATAPANHINLTFENCVFDSCQFGAYVGKAAKAIFLNCLFINNSNSGISCQCGGQVDIIASTFIHNSGGIHVTDKSSICNISYSRIQHSRDHGLIVLSGGKALLNDCHISNCGRQAAAIESSCFDAANCCFNDSSDGLMIIGKCFIQLEHCIIANNKNIGVQINIDFIGELLMNNCNIHSSGVKDIENNGLSKSRVIIDGDIFPTNGEEAESYNSDPTNYSNITQFKGIQSINIKLQRNLKCAGIIDCAPSCSNCLKQETPGNRFKKCKICLGAVYCSKECQILDWPKHGKVCKNSI